MTGTTVRTLLLATDLSPRCDRAVERAVALARLWDARLEVLTVLDPAAVSSETIAAARETVAASLGGYAAAAIHVLDTPVEQAIVTLARETEADLIVTGPSGETWLGQSFLGQTLKSLMRTTHAPVLLVRAPVHRAYRRVVISVDLSDSSRAPVEAAAQFFGRSASLSVFHAFNTPFRMFADDARAYEAGVREGVTLEIRDALHAWSVPDAANLPVIADYGEPARKLEELVQRHDIDVVVVGTHGRSGVMSLMLGSVAQAIVETVRCDVLIAPSRGAWPG